MVSYCLETGICFFKILALTPRPASTTVGSQAKPSSNAWLSMLVDCVEGLGQMGREPEQPSSVGPREKNGSRSEGSPLKWDAFISRPGLYSSHS